MKTALEIAMERAEELEAIPAMSDPLGKYWKQPNRNEIQVYAEHACMSRPTFDALASYNASYPSGVYEGKMWKRQSGVSWFLMWYGKDLDPSKVSINGRKIVIVGEALPREHEQ